MSQVTPWGGRSIPPSHTPFFDSVLQAFRLCGGSSRASVGCARSAVAAKLRQENRRLGCAFPFARSFNGTCGSVLPIAPHRTHLSKARRICFRGGGFIALQCTARPFRSRLASLCAICREARFARSVGGGGFIALQCTARRLLFLIPLLCTRRMSRNVSTHYHPPAPSGERTFRIWHWCALEKKKHPTPRGVRCVQIAQRLKIPYLCRGWHGIVRCA